MKINKIIHHILLSHTSLNTSWWEKAMIEVVKYIQKNNIKQVIYTSESWKLVYNKFISNKNLEYVIIWSISIEKFSEIFAYFFRIIQIFFYVKKFDKTFENIIFSHEEFLPTSIYSLLLKLKNKSSKWICFFHMKSPWLFRWYIWEYTWKTKLFPDLKIIRYKIEQYIFFVIINWKIDKLLTVNPIYKDYLLSKINKFRNSNWNNLLHVISNYSWENISLLEIEKIFDLSFMWRFHEQKWINEVIDIVLKLKLYKKDISIVVIWWWNKNIEKKFLNDIKKNQLENNITYKWFITWSEKFRILSSSKIFLFPSYYESFGQVALESMKLWLPVVAYDLPPFCIFNKWMIKVKILDNNKMSEEILSLLNDNNKLDIISKEALDFSKNFSWEITWKEIYNLL